MKNSIKSALIALVIPLFLTSCGDRDQEKNHSTEQLDSPSTDSLKIDTNQSDSLTKNTDSTAQGK